MVSSQWPFAQNATSVESSANVKVNNEMKAEAVHRSPGIYLTGKLQLGDHVMKVM